MSNISFLAASIGSLPHNNTKEAVEMVFKYLPDCPVLPQLANVSPREDMMSQPNERIPGVVWDEADKRWYMDVESETFAEELEEFFVDYENIISGEDPAALDKYAISEKHCSSLPLFLEKLAETKPAFVKGQITGPFTFGTSLVDREKRCAFFDDTLREILVKALTLKALWLVEQFRKASPNSRPIIFMDEPSASQYGTSAFITVKKEDLTGCFSEISSILKEAGALTGIHCCGKSDWSLIVESGVDILNFDAYYFAESLSLYHKEIASFLQSGGIIAWGVVPTLDTDALDLATPEQMIEKYEAAVSYLINKGISREVVSNATIITPSCGAGGLTLQQAEKAMRLTSGLAGALKEKYALNIA